MARPRAFTFVELMITVTVIAVLAAIAIPNFLEAQTRSKVSRVKAELPLLKMAVEAYRLETRLYPLNRTPGLAGPEDLNTLTTPIPYITGIPADLFTMAEATHNPQLRPIPYRYFNAIQVSPEKGLTFEKPSAPRAPESNKLGGGFLTGLLWGYGPAGPGPFWGNSLPATRISPKGEAFLIAYDPTNGTTSYGDIYQRIP